MEERRIAVRLAAAAALGWCGIAAACEPGLAGTRLESPSYVLAYRTEPPAVGRHFSLELAVCARDGARLPESVKVDAHMPEHRHGMNDLPELKPLGPGRWRAEGLMLHMPGRWELVFELRGRGASERLARSLTLE
jgi:hypothetical protein